MKMKKASRKVLAMMAVTALMSGVSVVGAADLISHGTSSMWGGPVSVTATGEDVAASLDGQNVNLNDVIANNVNASNVVSDSFSTTDGKIIGSNGILTTETLNSNVVTGETIQNTDGTFQVNGNGDVTANNVNASNVVSDSFSTTDGKIIGSNGILTTETLNSNVVTGETIQNTDGTFQVNGNGDVTANNVNASNVVSDSFSTTDGKIIGSNGILTTETLNSGVVTGETIQTAGGEFSADMNGNVHANNVVSDTFQNEEGTFLVAGDGSVTSVKVNGNEINGGVVTGETIQTAGGEFSADMNGNVHANNVVSDTFQNESGSFLVAGDGSVTTTKVTAGVVAGETVQNIDGSFTADSNGNVTATTVDTTGLSVSDDQGNTNFQVTADGSVTAKGDLTLGGDLNVNGTVVTSDELKAAGTAGKVIGTAPISVTDSQGNAKNTLTEAVNTNNSMIHENAVAIQNNTNAINSLDSRVDDLGGEIDQVGAISAALAGLHPLDYDGTGSKFQLSAAMGSYDSTQAAAIGAFYHFNRDVMISLGGATSFDGDHKTAGNLGVTFRVGAGASGKAVSDDVMARLEAMDQKIAALEQENKNLKNVLGAIDTSLSKEFPDVPANHWAYEAVTKLAGNDVVAGYPDGEFHGDRTMTRYEMAEIIYKAMNRGVQVDQKLVDEFQPEMQQVAANQNA